MSAPKPPPEVAGHELPGGEFHIGVDADRRLCAALYTQPAADGTAHPIWAYIATQSGMGLSVDGLLALCDFDAKDGPMLGSSDTEYQMPLRSGQTYRVSGRIEALTRKQSRRLGVMDVLEYRLQLHGADGEPVLSVRNTWILPRGKGDAEDR